MTELDTARQIRDGLLPSPTQVGGMTLWNMRLFGTGLSYRAGIDEFVWRDEKHYLNDEMLQRSMGIPVIWDHPEGSALNSKEFAERVIGTVMLPYIKNDVAEIWAVARVYDQEANKAMTAGQLSTSPAVVFGTVDDNHKIDLGDGNHLLIEGIPSLIDHVAVCNLGVWDRGGPPTGILNDTISERNDSMTDEEQKKFDSAMQTLASMTQRMDALQAEREEEKADKAKKDAAEAEEKAKADKAKKDADEEMAADKAKKDAFETEEKAKADAAKKDADEKAEAEEKAKADAAKKDADDKEAEEFAAKEKAKKDADDKENEERESGEKEAAKKADEDCAADKAKKDAEEDEKRKEDSTKADAAMSEMTEVKAQLAAMAALVKQLTAETSSTDRDALASAQARADAVAAMFGDRASPPISGETPLAYRKRLLKGFQRHSDQFKDTEAAAFSSLNDAMLTPIESMIYADAQAAARNPDTAGVGVIVPVVERDSAGRQITRYVGDPMAWMQHHMGTGTGGFFNRFNQNGFQQ